MALQVAARTDSEGRPAAVVGAKLLYPSGLVQHAGIHHSRLYGWYDHRFRFAPADLHEPLSFPLPVMVICELLGREHLPQIQDFIYRFDRGYYPELFPTHELFRKVPRYTLALGKAGSLERIRD